MSAGPSTSTKRGRTVPITCRTSRAHAGLWCRTPTTVTPGTLASGEQVAGLVERLPRVALAARDALLEVAADLLQVVGVVLRGRAGEALDDVRGRAAVAAQEP